jgi:hypothetical protein
VVSTNYEAPPLCNFLRSPVTSSPLGPNILLSTLFSKTLSLRSSLDVRDQVLHPYNLSLTAELKSYKVAATTQRDKNKLQAARKKFVRKAKGWSRLEKHRTEDDGRDLNILFKQ